MGSMLGVYLAVLYGASNLPSSFVVRKEGVFRF